MFVRSAAALATLRPVLLVRDDESVEKSSAAVDDDVGG